MQYEGCVIHQFSGDDKQMSKASYEWKKAIKENNQLCLENNLPVLASWHRVTLKRWRFVRRVENRSKRRIRRQSRNIFSGTRVFKPTQMQWLCDPNLN